MSTILNFGNMEISFDYKNPQTSQDFNKLNNEVIRPGVYDGLNLTYTDSSTITISSGTFFIKNQYDPNGRKPIISAKIRLTSSGTLTKSTALTYPYNSGSFDKDHPYIVINMDWSNTENYYPDFLGVSLADLSTSQYQNCVLLGKAVFNISNVFVNVDTTLKNEAYVKIYDDRKNNLKVTPTDPYSTSIQVNSGNAMINGRFVKILTTLTLDLSTITDGRVDLICIDETGTLSKISGLESISPVSPSFPSNKLVLAIITRKNVAGQYDISKDIITGRNIENIIIDKYSNFGPNQSLVLNQNNTISGNNLISGNNTFSGDNTFNSDSNNTFDGINIFNAANIHRGNEVHSGDEIYLGNLDFEGNNVFGEETIQTFNGNTEFSNNYPTLPVAINPTLDYHAVKKSYSDLNRHIIRNMITNKWTSSNISGFWNGSTYTPNVLFTCLASSSNNNIIMAGSSGAYRLYIIKNGVATGLNTDSSVYNISSICYASEWDNFVACSDSGTSGANRFLVINPNTNVISYNFGSTFNKSWNSITFSDSLQRFVAISTDGYVAYSDDRVNWNLYQLTSEFISTTTWNKITWIPEKSLFVACTSGTNTKIMISSTGLQNSWTLQYNPLTSQGILNSICYSQDLNKIFIFSKSNNNLYSSTDGLIWTPLVTSPNIFFYRVVWNNELGVFLGIRYSSTPTSTYYLYYSFDGITWNTISDTDTGNTAIGFTGLAHSETDLIWNSYIKKYQFISNVNRTPGVYSGFLMQTSV